MRDRGIKDTRTKINGEENNNILIKIGIEITNTSTEEISTSTKVERIELIMDGLVRARIDLRVVK